MNLWILKYDKESFSDTFIERLSTYVQTIPQLKHHEVHRFSKDKFHFFSISSKGIPKTYNEISEEGVRGYSGLLIDKSPEQRDLRNIANLDVRKPNDYYGQFSLFDLKNNSFKCFTDNLGFHKVFYGEKKGVKYVSNSFEFMKQMDVFEPNLYQMLKDFSTIRYGIVPGYNTLLQEVFTLTEYGWLEITGSGELKTGTYKDLSELLTPKGDFESKLKETIIDYQTIAAYLRKYHKVAIGLSGGFDGRLILNIFHKSNGKSLETFTYNRAGNLDLYIASFLSKKAGVPHRKFVIKPDNKKMDLKISPFKDSSGDAFTLSFRNALKDFYFEDSEFKVTLGGNGGDTDWEFGEKRIVDVDKSNLQSFIHDYAQKLGDHPILNEELKQRFSLEMEDYLWNKYKVFSEKKNFQQLLASAFFHLERFRSEQGFAYSQNSNKNHDVFAPFAIESFNQLIFLANKNQLQRGLREGIHYRLSDALTEGRIPYAPIITSAISNEHGNNIFQNLLNKIAPYIPKVIWKLNGGDTNTRIRKKYQADVNKIYQNYINKNQDSEIFDLIDKEKVLRSTSQVEYKGNYNAIGSMIKTLNDYKAK